MTMKRLFVAAGLVPAFNTQAKNEAIQLFTPTLWAIAPDMFACNLTNVSNKNRTVQVRIINRDANLHPGI